MSDELRAEYEFDYAQAKPNRFAAKLSKGGRLVMLAPDVAAAFAGSDEVNAVAAGTAAGGAPCRAWRPRSARLRRE